MPTPRLALLALALGALVGCSAHLPTSTRTAAPDLVARCRSLTPADVARTSNDADTVGCADRHTAETFLVGHFPSTLRRSAYTAPALGKYVYGVCQPGLVSFLGGDESQTMRSLFSWAWFRPSEAAWKKGARWFRCDVVGGPDGATTYRALPRTASKALAAAPPRAWMMCARGATVAGSPKVPCSQQHDWRAVTTIKLGQPQDPYPGDRLAAIRTQQFCSDSVGAWLGYPTTNYRYGVTVFHEAEWRAGNRRSICWARTTT